MKLGKSWWQILTRAWSVRFMILAALLTGLETIFPLAWEVGWVDLSFSLYTVLLFLLIVGAVVTRLMVQRNLSEKIYGP